MDELRKLLTNDIEERRLIREDIYRIKVRQTVLIIIGILIIGMFSLNYFQVREQQKKEDQIIEMLNDVVRAGRLLIESQEERMDSLIDVEYLPKK